MAYADVAAALTSIKTASDLITLIYKSKVDRAITEKAQELNSQIILLQNVVFDLQTQNQSLLKETDDLKRQLAQMEQWQTEAARYELKELDAGVFVYALKPDLNTGEPVHWLCPNCYQQHQKSILQLRTKGQTSNMFLCPHCKTELFDRSGPHNPPTSFQVYR